MSTPAGWYDDGHGAQRWWDGAQWTEHVQPVAEAAPTAVDESAPASAAAPEAAPAAAGDVAAVPAGYPPAPGEAPKPTSKLWILWVVLGVVVILLIALAAILIPILIGLFSSSTGGASSDAERGAVATVELYDDAWNDVDCDAYQRSTTEVYRDSVGMPDCAAFEEQAGAFADTSDDYEIEVTAVTSENGVIVVDTVETYESLVDEDGAPLEEPVDAADYYRYTLVEEDGTWLIDQLEDQ